MMELQTKQEIKKEGMEKCGMDNRKQRTNVDLVQKNQWKYIGG